MLDLIRHGAGSDIVVLWGERCPAGLLWILAACSAPPPVSPAGEALGEGRFVGCCRRRAIGGCMATRWTALADVVLQR